MAVFWNAMSEANTLDLSSDRRMPNNLKRGKDGGDINEAPVQTEGGAQKTQKSR